MPGIFFGAPHPDQGRPGTVCPFVPTSLAEGCFYISCLHGVVDPAGTEAAARRALAVFQQLEPKTGSLAVFKSLSLAFPALPPDLYELAIDRVQEKLKPLYIREGFMLGQFHPHQKETGLHSKTFHPFRSPVPILAIRHMHVADAVFLYRNAESRAVYLHKFGVQGARRILKIAGHPGDVSEAEKLLIKEDCEAFLPPENMPLPPPGCPFHQPGL